jgi:hypothetical protein
MTFYSKNEGLYLNGYLVTWSSMYVIFFILKDVKVFLRLKNLFTRYFEFTVFAMLSVLKVDNE